MIKTSINKEVKPLSVPKKALLRLLAENLKIIQDELKHVVTVLDWVQEILPKDLDEQDEDEPNSTKKMKEG